LGHNLAMPPTDTEANGTDRDVLTSLPRTRPSRRSAKRDRPGRAGGEAPAASGSSRPTASSGTPAAPETAAAPTAATTAAARPKTTAARAKPKAASPGAKPKAASSRAKRASTSRSRTGTSTAAKPRAATRPTAARTAATAEAASVAAEAAVPPAGYATEAQAHAHGPDPFAVVTTAVQAAGEIAQIGATLWGQAVRTAISRLPRP
jgi:hypothetical protein